MQIKFSDQVWEDYLFWQGTDRATLKRINTLLKEIQRAPLKGLGNQSPSNTI